MNGGVLLEIPSFAPRGGGNLWIYISDFSIIWVCTLDAKVI